jgi:DNA-binding transcriptional ArsR family regulator
MSREAPTIPDTRDGDETVLRMLQLRDEKLTVREIAANLGVTKGTVSGWLFRVDLATDEARAA